MIENLFIIGNGFDKAHGLNTDYYDFYRYLSDSKGCDEVALLDFLINYTELNDSDACLWKLWFAGRNEIVGMRKNSKITA